MAAAPEASHKPGGPWPSSTALACPPPGGPAHQAYPGCSMESTGSRWGWWQKLFSFSAWCWFEAHGASWRSSHSWQLPSFLAYSWPQTREQSHSPASRRRQLIFLAGFQKSTSGRQHGYRCAAGRTSPAPQLDTVLQAGVTSVLQEDGTWLWGLSSSFSHLKCWGKYCRNWRQELEARHKTGGEAVQKMAFLEGSSGSVPAYCEESEVMEATGMSVLAGPGKTPTAV